MRPRASPDGPQPSEPDETAAERPIGAGSSGRPAQDQAIPIPGGRRCHTALGLALFVVFQSLFGPTIGYMATLVLSYAIAILCSFALQRRFVFQVRGRMLLDLGRFTLVNLTALGLNAVLLPFFVEIVNLSPVPAQVVSLAIVLVFNYIGHSLFSFRR